MNEHRSPVSHRVVLLLGVTASGKSAAAIRMAQLLNAEIISADSMQVYRRMNIGTAKPTPDELSRIPHHLIDVVEPCESFSAARFVEQADAAIRDVLHRGRTPLILAGTPLYLMSLMFGMFEGPSADVDIRTRLRRRAEVEGTPALHGELTRIDPDAAMRIHPNDYKRIERAMEVHALTGRTLSSQQGQWATGRLRYPATVVGIRRSKEDASRRINLRVRTLMEQGLLDEVRALLSDPRGLGEQARQAVGYAEMLDHIEGRCSLEEAVERIKIHTRRLAKHQRTWFRKFTMADWVEVEAHSSDDKIATLLLERIRAVDDRDMG